MRLLVKVLIIGWWRVWFDELLLVIFLMIYLVRFSGYNIFIFLML